MKKKANCLCVLGPTATGKTSLGVKLASFFDGEIISADSRQVYKGLDIGSGKDLREFELKNPDGTTKQIPYHLIDVADVRNEYNVFHYQTGFFESFSSIIERKKLPLMVGGTGMYLDSIIRSYDMVEVPKNDEFRKSFDNVSNDELAKILLSQKSDLHNKTDLEDRDRMLRALEIIDFEKTDKAKELRKEIEKRPKVNPFILGLTFPRKTLRERITKRLIERLDEGMIAEVENLHKNGVTYQRLERLGLEYRFVAEYLQNKRTYDELVKHLNIAIGQFAKRQETWFRGMQKKGVEINWIPTTEKTTADEVYENALKILKDADFAL